MWYVWPHQADDESGQSLVEFALILSVLLLLLMGIFDFGRAFYANSALTHAAREGARYGIANYRSPSCVADTTKRVVDSAIGLDTGSTIMTISVTCGDKQVKVIADYKFYAATGYISRFFGAQGYLSLHAETTMNTGE